MQKSVICRRTFVLFGGGKSSTFFSRGKSFWRNSDFSLTSDLRHSLSFTAVILSGRFWFNRTVDSAPGTAGAGQSQHSVQVNPDIASSTRASGIDGRPPEERPLVPRKSRRFVDRILPDLSQYEPPPVVVVPLLSCDELFSTLAGHRCEIITLLAFAGCLCVGEIARRLQLSGSTVSRELRCLLKRGIVAYERDLTSHRFALASPLHWRARRGRVQFGMQLPNGDWVLVQRSSILDVRRNVPLATGAAIPVPGLSQYRLFDSGDSGNTGSLWPAATPQRSSTPITHLPDHDLIPLPLNSCNQLFHAFGGHRYEILTLLALEGQMRSGQLATSLGLSQPVISRELHELRVAALVHRDESASTPGYRLASEVRRDVKSGRVRLGVHLPSGDWMLLHREEFSEDTHPCPLPTEWVEHDIP